MCWLSRSKDGERLAISVILWLLIVLKNSHPRNLITPGPWGTECLAFGMMNYTSQGCKLFTELLQGVTVFRMLVLTA